MHVCQSGVYESLSGSGKIDQFLLNPETNVIEASNQLSAGSGFHQAEAVPGNSHCSHFN